MRGVCEMKKLLILVTLATFLHTNNTRSMLYGAAQAVVHKATKLFYPEGYILDSQNEKLYNAILKAINEKTISDLRVMQFNDYKGDMQTFEYTVSRIEERSSTLNACILNLSLIGDPVKQDAQKLYDMITVNIKNVSDIALGLALKSLQEQKFGEIPATTKSIQSDILFFRFSLSAEDDKQCFKKCLQKDNDQITLEQYFNLPQEEQEKRKKEILAQKKLSIIQTARKKRDNNVKEKNSSSRSPKEKDEFPTRKKRETSPKKIINNSLDTNNHIRSSSSKVPQNTPNPSHGVDSQDLKKNLKELSTSKELSKIPMQSSSQKLLDNDDQETLELNATKKKDSDASAHGDDEADEADEDNENADDIFDTGDNNDEFVFLNGNYSTEEDEEQS
jgi:hypothetical protein